MSYSTINNYGNLSLRVHTVAQFVAEFFSRSTDNMYPLGRVHLHADELIWQDAAHGGAHGIHDQKQRGHLAGSFRFTTCQRAIGACLVQSQ